MVWGTAAIETTKLPPQLKNSCFYSCSPSLEFAISVYSVKSNSDISRMWHHLVWFLCEEKSPGPGCQASLAHTSLSGGSLLLLHSANWGPPWIGTLSLAPEGMLWFQQKADSARRRDVQQQEAYVLIPLAGVLCEHGAELTRLYLYFILDNTKEYTEVIQKMRPELLDLSVPARVPRHLLDRSGFTFTDAFAWSCLT